MGQAQQLWLLSSFCALSRKSFDPAVFAQRFPPPGSIETFGAACAALGLRLDQRSNGLRQVLAWRVPVAVAVAGKAAGDTDWALVLNADERQVIVLERGAPAPAAVGIAELAARYRGHALSLTPMAEEAADPDDIERRSARFGLRWFVPELLKHRPVWRDVLIASLVMQLMALALPLFTQVIIDKVVVHRTQSTLIALGVGMARVHAVHGALSWVRQYLVLHTGNRVDAVLGSQVFDQLCSACRCSYFQHRPTGVIAARLQGIETIREFIAGGRGHA